MKKILLVLLSMALVFSMSAPSGASEADTGGTRYKIGMSVLNLSNPFFMALSNAAREAADEFGVELMLNDPQDNAERQVAGLENFIAGGVDAIVVTSVDPAAVLPIVQAARAEGIVVVCHTTRLEEYDAWVAADEYDMMASGCLFLSKDFTTCLKQVNVRFLC